MRFTSRIRQSGVQRLPGSTNDRDSRTIRATSWVCTLGLVLVLVLVYVLSDWVFSVSTQRSIADLHGQRALW